MTLARLLRLSRGEARRPGGVSPGPTWPCDNPMMLGIPRAEFTVNVRRAVWALLGEARNLRAELERTRAMLRDAQQAIDRDDLLPVLNRRAFVRELERQIASSARYARPVSLAYFDLDGLKRANDMHGHACGDAILVHFSSLLLSTLRSSDVVGRLGGDEFGIIVLYADKGEAEAICARITDVMRAKPLDWQGRTIPVPFTFGVVQLAAGLGAEEAIAAADSAMYQSKSLRR